MMESDKTATQKVVDNIYEIAKIKERQRMKAKFSICGFNTGSLHSTYQFNLTLCQLMKTYPEYFNNCEISSVYDGFHHMFWYGGRNNRWYSKPQLALDDCEAIIKNFNNLGISIKMVCSNNHIEKKHLNDYYSNEIMSFMNDSDNNIVILTSDILKQHIQENYPNIKIELSTTAGFYHPEDLNKLTKEYDMVVPDFKINNDWENLVKIEDRNKIELACDETCDEACNIRHHHYSEMNRESINGWGTMVVAPYHLDIDKNCKFLKYKDCNYYQLAHSHPLFITNDDIYSKYIVNGFENFKIVGRDAPLNLLLEKYLYYLVKPEYLFKVGSILNWTMFNEDRHWETFRSGR